MAQRRLRKPRLANATKGEPKLVDAVLEVGGLLPKSASVFVGLTGIAYFAGWREGVAYYTALGAPWVVSSLPPFSFLFLSAGMIASIALNAFLALHHIATRKQGHKHVAWASAVLVIIAGCLTLAPTILPSRWLSPSRIWWYEEGHAQLMFIAAGGLLGEAISQFRNEKLKWSPAIAYTVYLFALYGLYNTPADRGTARAHFHLAPSSNALPLVTVAGGPANEQWRLVELIGQMALLIKPPLATELPTFKLVQVKDIGTIRQPISR
jgi:hypothetical protein